MISALRTGEMDIIHNFPGDQAAAIKQAGFNVAGAPLASCLLALLLPNHPLNRDRRVREAINLAVNREELLKTVLGGFGRVPQGQIIEPGILGYRKDIQPVPYDPERARALFRQAGAEGAEMVITTSSSSRPAVDAVVGYLNAAGVRARTDSVERAVFLKAILEPWDKPLVVTFNHYFQIRDFDSVAPRYTSAWRPATWFDNEQMTELYRASRVEMDEQRRADLIGQMLQIMRDEFAVLWLSWLEYPFAYSNRIRALNVPYDQSFPIWRIEKEA